MSGKQFETILYEKSGPVATLTMNRPDAQRDDDPDAARGA